MSDLEHELIEVLEGISQMYLDNIGNTVALLERLMPYMNSRGQEMIPDLKEMREIRAAQELYVREMLERAKEATDG